MLYALRNYDYVALLDRTRLLALLLIPAFSGGANQNLTAALVGVMDVPVVATAGLKGDVEQRELSILKICQRIEKALSNKILCKIHVRIAFAEHICFCKFVFILIYHGNYLLILVCKCF